MPRNTVKPSVFVDEGPTTDLYLPSIIERTPCPKHLAERGTSCYLFEAAEGDTWHNGICNSRALAAGMNGRIHPMSLDRSLSAPRTRGN
jgi:hypothetical protein